MFFLMTYTIPTFTHDNLLGYLISSSPMEIYGTFLHESATECEFHQK